MFESFSAEVRRGGMVLTVTSLLEVDGCPPIKLREERDNEDVPLRTGCRVWSCARLLAEWLANRSGGGEDDGAGPIVVGRDVLELGAGTGAVGLTCAALGASSVTMTDRDEAALALMHTNARINGHYDASSTCEVCVQGLDWGDPATYIQGASYDLVVAADVLYLPEHCAALPDAVAAHLAPGGEVVVACGLRRAGLLEALVDSLRSVGLDDVCVDLGTLGLDPVDGGDARNRAAAAVTASEHAHDGAQISAAGGYVLVTAAAAADWKPPERLSARAVADAKRGREEEERNEASRPRIRGEGNRIVGARRSEERKGGDGAVASETAATREEDREGEPGEIDSDANDFDNSLRSHPRLRSVTLLGGGGLGRGSSLVVFRSARPRARQLRPRRSRHPRCPRHPRRAPPLRHYPRATAPSRALCLWMRARRAQAARAASSPARCCRAARLVSICALAAT